MAKQKNTNGSAFSGLIAGVLIGALGTMAFSSFRHADDSTTPQTSQMPEAQNYGVGGGDVLTDSDKTTTTETPSKEQKNQKPVKKTKKNASPQNTNAEPAVGGGIIQEPITFSFPALTQPKITTLNTESTVYEYDDTNVILVLTGNSASSALNSIIVQDETEVQIDGYTARDIQARSLQDGDIEQLLLIEMEGQLIIVSGSHSFIEQVKTDMTFND